eukprot:gb/GECH01009113.1/.p1 GENE.gb/GECH01009113.1/~~gb/GECH01009113.1/.p1  ORF type:complete len:443 (+),score=104.75 gb/GECH01009113.1/:1-1329(+)
MYQYDYIIIGGGVLGSAAAYHCVKETPSARVLLLEQFDLLHSRGSSHGHSRIIREAYDDPIYSRMGSLALDMWKETEHEYNTTHDSSSDILTVTGGLDVGPKGCPDLDTIADALNAHEFSYERLSADQVRNRFPAFNPGLKDEMEALFSPRAGILNAENAVHMLHDLIRYHGGEIMSRACVTRIVNNPENGKHDVHVRIKNDNESEENNSQMKEGFKKRTVFQGEKIIIAAGAWTNRILKSGFSIELDLEVRKNCYAFFNVSSTHREIMNYRQMPIWIYWEWNQDNEKYPGYDIGAYGFPILENPHCFKCGGHYAVSDERHSDPETRDFQPSQKKLELMKRLICDRIGLGDNVSWDQDNNGIAEATTCLYTSTPTEDFIIDVLPGKSNQNIAVLCGGSGHAFKHGVLLGKMVKYRVDHSRNSFILHNDIPASKFSIMNHCKE